MRNLFMMGIGILVNSAKGENKMSVEQEKSVVREAVHTEQALWCPEIGVAMFGVELVSKKLVNIIRTAFKSEDEHGIRIIRFSEDMPKSAIVDEMGNDTGKFKNVLADYDFEAGSIVVNITAHFETAMDRIMSGTKNMRVGAYIFANMLVSVFHEVYESHKSLDADNPYLVSHSDEDEDKCERLAKELLMELARTVNIEAPVIEEESPIIAEFIKEFEDSALQGDEEWSVEYRILLEKSLVYKDGDTEIPTLREYYKRYAEGSGDASEWPESVHTITNESFVILETPASVQMGDLGKTLSTATPMPAPLTAPIISPEDIEPDFGDVEYGEAPAIIPGINATIQTTAPVTVVTPETPPSTPATPMGIIVPQPVGQPNGTPTPQAQAPELPVHQLTVQNKLDFMRELSLRMFDMFFGHCGFQANPATPADQPFPGFSNPNGIFGFVQVADIPFAKECLYGVRTIDETTGQKVVVDIWNPQIAGWPAGCIRGLVWTKGKFTSEVPLPGYHLILNVDGFKSERTFMPQNANTRYPDGNLKTWAKEARAGVMRAMLVNDKSGQNDKIQLTVTTNNAVHRQVMLRPLDNVNCVVL